MNKFLTGFFATLMALSGIGCSDMDNYSVSPNHLLTFSTDTVSFDTVFTTVGSTTEYFMIYNKHDEALKISTIILANGGGSGFRLNIDGRKGDLFHDIPIWKKDSLYVAVEVTINPNDNRNPFVIQDSVIFITNGMRQAVLLEAYGQNVRIYRGGTIFNKDTTLRSELPYLVYDSMIVAKGVTLTLDEGASFFMHQHAKWLIEGTLKAKGTQDSAVLFRGDRLDAFYGVSNVHTDYDHLSSQWDGIYFGADSYGNVLEHTIVRNGASGLTFAASAPDRKKAHIENSQITNMDGNALTAINCHIEAVNTEFSNASNHLILLQGGKSQFTHCTLANYMPPVLMSGSITRMPACLTLSDTLPLQQAYFDNCIIDGNNSADTTHKYSGEIAFLSHHIDGDDGNFNYRFNHCLIKTQTITNKRFTDCLFVESPLYIASEGKEQNDGDNEIYNFIYDFRLSDESPGIGSADRSIAEKHPTDRLGVNRISSENGPSIGAYEYVPQKEK